MKKILFRGTRDVARFKPMARRYGHNQFFPDIYLGNEALNLTKKLKLKFHAALPMHIFGPARCDPNYNTEQSYNCSLIKNSPI